MIVGDNPLPEPRPPKGVTRALILGTVNHDRLLFPSGSATGSVRSSLGGVCYSLLALAALDPGLEIHAGVLAGIDLRNVLESLLAGGGIAPGKVFWRDAPTNTIELDCRNPHCKRERSRLTLGGYGRGDCPGIPFPGVLLNFTSGREFTLPVWRQWHASLRRRNPSVYIQVDLHSLSLSYRAGRARAVRPLPRWRDWFAGTDLLQLTLDECACLHPYAPTTLEETATLCRDLLAHGVAEVVITDGARGFLHATPEGTRHWPAPVVDVIDTTGCGDVLGAALFEGRLSGYGPGERMERARAAATLKLGFSGPEELVRLGSLRRPDPVAPFCPTSTPRQPDRP